MKKIYFRSFLLTLILIINQLYLCKAQAQSTKYSVFCASGKIEVDMRTLEQMKSARGSNVCKFAEFTSLTSAQDFATKNFHNVGASCTCGS